MLYRSYLTAESLILSLFLGRLHVFQSFLNILEILLAQRKNGLFQALVYSLDLPGYVIVGVNILPQMHYHFHAQTKEGAQFEEPRWSR